MPAAGPRLWSFFSDFGTSGAGSVLVRREKKPNLDVLLVVGGGAGLGSVFERGLSALVCTSGVGPRVGAREAGVNPDVRLGLGDGLREDGFAEIPNLALPPGITPVLDSVDVVRLCDDGKLLMLLWITGDGPRNRLGISGVPSLLGLTGLRLSRGTAGVAIAKCASSGGA